MFLKDNILNIGGNNVFGVRYLAVAQRGSIEFHGYGAENKPLKAFNINC